MRHLSVAIVLALTSSSFAELVTNGGFEQSGLDPSPGIGAFTTYNQFTNTTALTGWSITTNGIDHIGTYWAPNSGSRSIDLNAAQPGTIQQTLSTVSGQQYTLTFYMAGNPDGGTSLKSMNVTVVGSTTDLSASPTFQVTSGTHTVTSMGWTLYTFTFVASSSSSVLTFQSTTSTGFGPALDDVSVLESPEPAALALFGLGLGGLGLWRRSQKKRARTLRAS